jgi:hypothetical protein
MRLPLDRFRLRSEFLESLNACLGAVSLARELQGAHACECRAPAEEPLYVHACRWGEPLGARCDRLEIIRLPEDQVDRVESGIAEAGCGVDRDEAALGSTVKDVAGRQVTVEQDDRGVVLREPGREPAPALVELRRDQRRELPVTFVELRRGVEQVGDALLDRRIGRVGNTAPVQGAQKLGDALRGGVRSRRRRAAFQVRSPRSEGPGAARRARSPQGCERCARRRARPPRTPSARGRGWPSAQRAARQPSGNGRRPTRSRAGSGSRARTATALQERSARLAARRTTPPLRCRSER